jgi:hypothetical protein
MVQSTWRLSDLARGQKEAGGRQHIRACTMCWALCTHYCKYNCPGSHLTEETEGVSSHSRSAGQQP